MVKKTSARKNKKTVVHEQLAFSKRNYIGFAIGLIMIVVGYISLSKGSMTLAPILLVLGYCVVVAIAIITFDKQDKEKGD